MDRVEDREFANVAGELWVVGDGGEVHRLKPGQSGAFRVHRWWWEPAAELAAKMAIYAVVYAVLLGGLLWWLDRHGGVPVDSTDPPRGRSGVRLVIDEATGCHYLHPLFGGMIPRLDIEGEHVCTGREREAAMLRTSRGTELSPEQRERLKEYSRGIQALNMALRGEPSP